MFYAIVAPGISGVYSEWKSIERIKALYPYPKFAKFEYEVDAYNWLKANKYSNKRHGIYNYGSTFHDRYIDVKYKIVSTTSLIVNVWEDFVLISIMLLSNIKVAKYWLDLIT